MKTIDAVVEVVSVRPLTEADRQTPANTDTPSTATKAKRKSQSKSSVVNQKSQDALNRLDELSKQLQSVPAIASESAARKCDGCGRSEQEVKLKMHVAFGL